MDIDSQLAEETDECICEIPWTGMDSTCAACAAEFAD